MVDIEGIVTFPTKSINPAHCVGTPILGVKGSSPHVPILGEEYTMFPIRLHDERVGYVVWLR